MGKLVFITGGARSGKSSFALREASAKEGKRLFVATLEPLDKEMIKRVALHRDERGDSWDTREEPLRLTELLANIPKEYGVSVFDCLTIWLSNVMHSKKDVTDEIAGLVAAFADSKKHIDVYVVSNEVGMGIVPENEMARAFRDYAGALNQKVASVADEVFFMVSGIPVKIK